MDGATKERLRRWHVVVDAGHLDMPGLGRARMQETVNVEAADEAEARAKAKEEKPGKPIYQVQEILTWAITLRGRHDKRRRETFLVNAADEETAMRNLSHNLAACRFARVYSRKDREQSVVKIEKKEAA